MHVSFEKLQWDTLRRSDGDSLVIDFDLRPRHIALIPFEVLEDGLQTINEEPLINAKQHRALVENAIRRALNEDNWQELVMIGTGQKLFQLWIGRSHFGQ